MEFNMIVSTADKVLAGDALEAPPYEPGRLIDMLIQIVHVKNDLALSKVLEVAPPIISKIRNGKMPVGVSILMRMHEATGLPIRQLRGFMGDHRKYFCITNPPKT
ncbi:hypothetical protein ACVBEF_07100 [Glaciimonas sp. GG7]